MSASAGRKLRSVSHVNLCLWGATYPSVYFKLQPCTEIDTTWTLNRDGNLFTSVSGKSMCLGWMKATDKGDVRTKVAVFSECLKKPGKVKVDNGSLEGMQQRWRVGSGLLGLGKGEIQCPPSSSSVLSSIQVTLTGLLVSKCAPLGAIGECVDLVTPEVDTDGVTLSDLPQLSMNCSRGAIMSVTPELSSGGKTFKYKYRCCELTEPAAISLTGASLSNTIPNNIGVYCPKQTRDVSGRLAYDQTSWFNQFDKNASHTLNFDNLEGRWCLTDSGCAVSDNAVPTDTALGTADWAALPTVDFAFAPDFAGATSKPPTKRKFPELIEFKAVQPKLKPECMDDVTPGMPGFDRDKMAKSFAELPSENPCLYVGGISAENSASGEEAGYVYTVAEKAYQLGGDEQYGMTYKDAFACSTRKINRGMETSAADFGFDTSTLVREGLSKVKDIACPAFPRPGLWAGFAAGTRTTWDAISYCCTKIPAICHDALSWVLYVWKFAQELVHWNMKEVAEDNDNNDCDPLQAGLARVLCSLHCVRDVTRAGDEAILKSMEKAAQVQTKNNDMLMEYYFGLIQDKLADMKPESAALVQDEVRADFDKAKGLSSTLFQEMRDLVSAGSFDESGTASLNRALSRLLAEEHMLVSKTVNRTGTSTGDLMTELSLLTQRAQRLHAVTKGVSGLRMSNKAVVEKEVHEYTIKHQRVLNDYNRKLGEHKVRADMTKTVQRQMGNKVEPTIRDVAAQLEMQHTEQLLVSLDDTWWQLRKIFDEYLEAVDDHIAAMQRTTSMLQDYTSMCSMPYPQLLRSFHETAAVTERAKKVVRTSWKNALPLLGLLVSKISDGDMLTHFARTDMLSVDVGKAVRGGDLVAANLSRMEGAISLSQVDLCTSVLSQEAQAAAKSVLRYAAYGPSGRALWTQTLHQVSIVLGELKGLSHWHLPLGLGPAPDMEDVEIAAERLNQIVKLSDAERSQVVEDALSGYILTNCKQ